MRGRDSRSEDHELEGDERFGIGGHHTLFVSGFMSSVFSPSQAHPPSLCDLMEASFRTKEKVSHYACLFLITSISTQV